MTASELKHKVQIGRVSGPTTDKEVESDFTAREIEIVKDTLAMVNKCVGRGEWFLIVDEGPTIVPTVR